MQGMSSHHRQLPPGAEAPALGQRLRGLGVREGAGTESQSPPPPPVLSPLAPVALPLPCSSP